MSTRRRTIVPALVLFVAAGLGIVACGSSSDSPSALGPEASAGKRLVQNRCAGCHTSDGARRTGPTFKGLAGSTVNLEGGGTAVADHAYLVESVLDPEAKVTKGYPNIMGSAVPKGSLSPEQAEQITLYLETLR